MEALETVTVVRPCFGEVDLTGRKCPVQVGTYEVVDIDTGERVGVSFTEVSRRFPPPADCEIVWLPLEPCGLASCLGCGGSGEYRYRVWIDEWESDGCEGCAGDGIITAAERAEQEAMVDRARADEMRDGL